MCQKVETFKSEENSSVSPIQLSRALNSVACSLSIKREDPLSIFHLILESRHYMCLLWNTGTYLFKHLNLIISTSRFSVQFWLCSCIAISVMQLLAAVLMLPALLTTGQVLWICCVIIPCLSVSLMGISVDPENTKKPQGKKQIGFNSEVCTFVMNQL